MDDLLVRITIEETDGSFFGRMATTEGKGEWEVHSCIAPTKEEVIGSLSDMIYILLKNGKGIL